MIHNIQVLRGVAALAVVYYHTGFMLYKNVHTDFQGVSIFFVISGFIMTYITQDADNKFLIRRIIRIVPLYWIITAVAFLCFSILFPTMGHFLHNRDSLSEAGFINLLVDNAGAFSSHILVLLKSFFFIPYKNEAGNLHPYLEVGWTLNLEMLFYLIIGVMLLFKTKRATILACFVLIGIKVLDFSLTDSSKVLDFYSHGYTTFFILGVFSYYAWLILGRIHFLRKKLVLFPIGFVVLCAYFAINTFGCHRYYSSYIIPFSVILMALLLHSSGLRYAWKPSIILGDASYALYLTHTVWIGIQQPLSIKMIPILKTDTIIGMFVALIMSCIIAIFVHYKIEKPTIRMLQRRFITRSSSV